MTAEELATPAMKPLSDEIVLRRVEVSLLLAEQGHLWVGLCKILDALKSENEKLRGALKTINGQCLDFEHGDDNLKAFVVGLGKHAARALAKG